MIYLNLLEDALMKSLTLLGCVNLPYLHYNIELTRVLGSALVVFSTVARGGGGSARLAGAARAVLQGPRVSGAGRLLVVKLVLRHHVSFPAFQLARVAASHIHG